MTLLFIFGQKISLKKKKSWQGMCLADDGGNVGVLVGSHCGLVLGHEANKCPHPPQSSHLHPTTNAGLRLQLNTFFCRVFSYITASIKQKWFF